MGMQMIRRRLGAVLGFLTLPLVVLTILHLRISLIGGFMATYIGLLAIQTGYGPHKRVQQLCTSGNLLPESTLRATIFDGQVGNPVMDIHRWLSRRMHL